MIDARSHQLFEVDSDHRLVTVTQHRKNDRERAKTINHEKQNEPDKVLQFLKEKKKKLTMKLSQVTKEDSRSEIKKQRNQNNNAIKKRKAHIVTKQLLDEALDINQTKDNAQAALALKKILKVPKKKTKPSITIDKLTNHFSSQFEKDESFNHSSRYTKLVGTGDIDQAIKKLKNGKAPGPD